MLRILQLFLSISDAKNWMMNLPSNFALFYNNNLIGVNRRLVNQLNHHCSLVHRTILRCDDQVIHLNLKKQDLLFKQTAI